MDTVDDFIIGYCDALEKVVMVDTGKETESNYIEIVDITHDEEEESPNASITKEDTERIEEVRGVYEPEMSPKSNH